MKINFMIMSLFAFVLILGNVGCDSVDEAIELKNRYDDLNRRYATLEKKYEETQTELEALRGNGSQYMENTKRMLQDD